MIDKNKVRRLLETSDRGYRDIAAEVGCSAQRVAQIASKSGVDLAARDRRSRKRAQAPRRVIGTHGIACPKCKSPHVRKNGRSNRYQTQSYRCVECRAKFMAEYKWITSGDRDRHLAIIARSSGYSRPDMAAHWARIRQRVWPYLQDSCGEIPDLLRVVNEAIPRTVPEHMRADICQDALVAILECRVEQAALTLKPFLRKWFKENVVGFHPLSLDQPSRHREGQTIGQEMGIC